MSSVYEIVTEKILAQLAQGVVPWRKPWRTLDHQNLKSRKPYRGINPFLLSIAADQLAQRAEAAVAGTDTPPNLPTGYWLTYNQATDMGAQVRKGEKSTLIVFWQFPSEKPEVKAKAKGAKAKRSDGSGAEKVERTAPILRYYNVFNSCQVDGLTLPMIDDESIVKLPSAEEVVFAYERDGGGPDVQHKGDRAAYSPALDAVRMPRRSLFTSSDAYYRTLFHELVHSTGHSKRLARPEIVAMLTTPGATTFGSDPYAAEELVAELGAAFLAAMVGGLEDIESSAAYIDGWRKQLGSDSRMVVVAAGRAQKAADWVRGIRPEKVTAGAEAVEVTA